LLGAARRLSYRGYDSVGAATIDAAGHIDLRKDVGKVDVVAPRLGFSQMRGRRGIVQLRWATFGAPSQVNAQPIWTATVTWSAPTTGMSSTTCSSGGVHSPRDDGPFDQRRRIVRPRGRAVREQGLDMVEAIRRAYHVLEGDYAFVIASVHDDRLYAFKKGSGLVVGLGDGFTCCSSDLPSLLPLTNKVVRLRDGEIVALTPDGVTLWSVANGARVEREPEVFTQGMDAAVKGGYAHFMLKEIHEQPEVARELLHLFDASPHVDPMVAALRTPATCTTSGAAPATTPAWWARCTPPGWPAGPRCPCWRRSSSRSTARR